MADDARHARPDLSGPVAGADDPPAVETDFFDLLRRLETRERRFGRAGGAEREPARLGQTARLAFAASDVAAVTPGQEGLPPNVAVNVIGLIGPEGPMPLHMTRWIMQRLSQRWFAGDTSGATADTSFLDFVNMLQHRQIGLYWRAWADARPEIHVTRADGDRITAMMRAIAGIGLPETLTGDQRIDGAKLHHATSLDLAPRSPERLSRFLETVLRVPVAVEEFVGRWIEIPEPLQTRLGVAHCGLGTGAVAGARVFDRQSRAELRLGPLTRAQFLDFLDDAAAWERLRHAVVFAMGKELDIVLRMVLAADEVPEARLGSGRLGRSIWLDPVPGRDADDLCFTRIAEPHAPAREGPS
ncbi:type VI secretion system baseplate subunit TssG [Roseivivax isoporae]|uniref:Type VI secretion protein n=1 Tax=Roseivivax isoporae LMG 25204 TaxID=1449351 RepID=X7FDW3_9RHOB|nr:type VI secretion system baseplate subunit TssG [Roseivivax isoporae]ETX30234.1 hypothetical protein RISW2_15480 [Roseivivax isoporae LMG 25204]